ncbi:hypothetical protein WS68_18095 [Burkholderia sp. TSV86]|nr:hypothetical protein WS68_18095 [Burkholderia sp. TSV86]
MTIHANCLDTPNAACMLPGPRAMIGARAPEPRSKPCRAAASDAHAGCMYVLPRAAQPRFAGRSADDARTAEQFGVHRAA